MKGLILSGGHGTRLRPITYTIQKQLVPIANKPIIFYVIQDLVDVGIKEIGIIVGPNKEQVKKIVGDGARWGVRITYIEQDEPRGLAHCVLIAKDFLKNEPFVMYLGDNLLKGGIKKLVETFTKEASIMLTHVPNPEALGNAELKKDGTIKRLVEKPKKPKSDLAVVGIYAFRKSIQEAAAKIKPSWRNELEIVDAIQWLMDHGKKVQSSEVEGFWKDTGRPEDLLEGNQLVLDEIQDHREGQVSQDSIVKGRVVIEKGAKILNKSRIQGPVIIGTGAVIDHSFIGPYTAVGKNAEIKQTEIEGSIIMDNSKISSGKRIVNSLIGANCHITSYLETLPHGHRIVAGDNSEIEL